MLVATKVVAAVLVVALIERYDVEKKKEDTVQATCMGYELTPDGKKLLYSTSPGNWFIASSAGGGGGGAAMGAAAGRGGRGGAVPVVIGLAKVETEPRSHRSTHGPPC